jgi:parvulin-like peptidyl-prolyl isomerase
VSAQGKWFIIKLEDRKTARQLNYDESREELKKELDKMRADELMENWISGLRARAIIQVLNQN